MLHPLWVMDCVVNQYAPHAQDFSGKQDQAKLSFVIFGRILVWDFLHGIPVAETSSSQVLLLCIRGAQFPVGTNFHVCLLLSTPHLPII